MTVAIPAAVVLVLIMAATRFAAWAEDRRARARLHGRDEYWRDRLDRELVSLDDRFPPC